MVHATQTRQFKVKNVGFFKDGQVIPRTAPLAQLLQANLVTLKITNQKNGRMDQTITQHATRKEMCPVNELAHIVFENLHNRGNNNTLLCLYKSQEEWHSVESIQVVSMVRNVAQSNQTW